jgi:predicted nucleotidyltransferase
VPTLEQTDALSRLLANLPEVRLAWLFGSRARGRARPDSDWDIAVLVEEAAAADAGAVKRTIFRLAGALGRAVPSESIDLVLLNRAPALLRHRVLRDGVPLLVRSESERVRFMIRAIREYQDFEPRMRTNTRNRIARLAERGDHDGGSGDLLAAARRVGRLLAQDRGLR